MTNPIIPGISQHVSAQLEAMPAHPLIPDAPISWPLLSEAECQETVRQIFELQGRWLPRHPAGPFYSLGAVSYMDAQGGTEARLGYEALAARENPMLLEAFGPLLRKVAASVAERLGQPVELTTRQALPGFHVFLSHPAFEQQQAPIHTDRQYELLDWEGAQPQGVFSVTLPIEIPRNGAWMHVWGVHARDWGLHFEAGWKQRLTDAPKHHVAYTAGHLVFHTGQFVHRIAPSKALGPDDKRITLQAHAVLLDGVWQLYW